MADDVYDAIVVGSGITGGWAAKELTEKGLRTLVVERGRAVEHGLGVRAGQPELFPELTITSDGAYWSPFGSTSAPGKPLDTEMLLTRQIEPLHKPLGVLISQLRATPPSADALIGIR